MCVATNGYRTSFGGDGNILEFYMIMFTQLCEYTKKKNHWIVYFNSVNFKEYVYL